MARRSFPGRPVWLGEVGNLRVGTLDQDVLPSVRDEGPTSESRVRFFDGPDNRAEARDLLANIKRDLPRLERLLNDDGELRHEDLIYRFWHQSIKVFWIQEVTAALAEALSDLHPSQGQLDKWFVDLVAEGTGRVFTMEDNQRWTERTRPMLEAFFHARFFVEMAVKYGRELDEPPRDLPSGWAAALALRASLNAPGAGCLGVEVQDGDMGGIDASQSDNTLALVDRGR